VDNEQRKVQELLRGNISDEIEELLRAGNYNLIEPIFKNNNQVFVEKMRQIIIETFSGRQNVAQFLNNRRLGIKQPMNRQIVPIDH
ncbi:unnamed protein product, partial [marine sediment metagenome]